MFAIVKNKNLLLSTRRLKFTRNQKGLAASWSTFHVRKEYKRKSKTRNSSDSTQYCIARIAEAQVLDDDNKTITSKWNHQFGSTIGLQTPGSVIIVTVIMAGIARTLKNELNKIREEKMECDTKKSMHIIVWTREPFYCEWRAGWETGMSGSREQQEI